MIQVKQEFLTKVGGITVERILDCKRSHERVTRAQEPNGVQHTTEGHWGPSESRFRHDTGTPTFMIGYEQLKSVNGKLTNAPASSSTKIRVAQFMPIGEMALTLKNSSGGTETNREALVQIELVGTCVVGANGMADWLPAPAVLKVLADLYKQLDDVAGIPLQRAGNNTRSVPRWDGKAGWFGHGEVPENDHSDPRNLKYAEIFKLASPKPVKVWQILSGGDILFQTPAAEINGVNALDRIGKWYANDANHSKIRANEAENGYLRTRQVEIQG